MGKIRYLSHVAITVTVTSDLYEYATGLEKESTRRERLRREAGVLKRQIERHCDINGSAEISEIYDEACDFCGASWTENDDVDNGGCCDKDAQIIQDRVDAVIQPPITEPS